ncbi:MAG: DNA-binding MarR family transcriptional regulator [Paraglaciecola sp.]|jgi:DNA-binding MarR family transcriptional regulator
MTTIIAKTHQLLLSRFGKINRLMVKVIESRLAPIGITYQEMRIAGLLMGENSMTQKVLAEKLSVRPATLSVAISKLEAQGLVKRVPSKTDKRVNFLYIIPNENITKVDKLLAMLEADITQGIAKKDLQVTSQVLAKIIDNLHAQERT